MKWFGGFVAYWLLFTPFVVTSAAVSEDVSGELFVEEPQLEVQQEAVFVSPSGSDQNDGSVQRPLQSLHAAMEMIRDGPRPVTIYVADGVGLTETLKMSSDVSGVENGRVTIEGWVDSPESSRPVVSGGVAVAGWEATETTVITDEGAEVSLTKWTAPLPSRAVESSDIQQLFVGDTRLVVARSPVIQYQSVNATAIVAKEGQVPADVKPSDNFVAVVYETWTASLHRVDAVVQGQTLLMKNAFKNTWAGSSGSRYWIQGAEQLMNTAGEFYVDYDAKTISFLAENGDPSLDPTKETAVIPVLKELVVVDGGSGNTAVAGYITIRNLALVHAAVDMDNCFNGPCDDQSASNLQTAAVRVTHAQDVWLEGVTVAHVGGYGLWFSEGAMGGGCSRCDIFDLGAGGVRVGVPKGGVVPDSSNALNVSLVDSVVTDGGHVFLQGTGVLVQTAANTNVSFNHIHNFSYSGVCVGWNWGYAASSTFNNVIHNNHIHNIGKRQLSDMACVYTLGRQPGTVVSDNLCHDVVSYDYGGWGLYTDEGSSNITLEGNVVHNTKCAGVHQHYGTNNLYQNNIFVDVNDESCDGTIRTSQHAGECVQVGAQGEDQGRCSSFTFSRNIIFLHKQGGNDNVFAYGASDHKWDNFTLDSNLVWDAQLGPLTASRLRFMDGGNFSDWQAYGKGANSIIADPQFANLPDQDFWDLNPSSPAITQLNFKPVPSHFGPRSSDSDDRETVTFGDAVAKVMAMLKATRVESNAK